MDTTIAFAGNPLDRVGNHRRDEEWVARQRHRKGASVLPISKSGALVAEGRLVFLPMNDWPEEDRDMVLLGLDGDEPRFAVNVTGRENAFEGRGDFLDLRVAGWQLSGPELALAGQAVWLTGWHFRHQFCARTGEQTRAAEGGMKRIGVDQGAEHFPRTDPVTIVLPIHDNAVCLGRGPQFPDGFVSAFAGFVEAGETLEECGARELWEETGLRVTSLRYRFSQPWPFPASLMCGFLAEVAGRDLTLDPKEIAEARWFDRSEVQTMLSGGDVSGYRVPPASTIAHQLLKDWAER